MPTSHHAFHDSNFQAPPRGQTLDFDLVDMSSNSVHSDDLDEMKLDDFLTEYDVVGRNCILPLIVTRYKPCRDSRGQVESVGSKRRVDAMSEDVNFDSAPASTYYNAHQPHHKRPCRPVSVNDLSTYDQICAQPNIESEQISLYEPQLKRRRVSADSTTTPDLSQMLGYSSGDRTAPREFSSNSVEDTLEYQMVYKNLAESIARTQLSRRKLVMLLTDISKQQNATTATSIQQKQQLQQRVANVSPNATANTFISTILLEKDSILADFFSGHRSTLTDGLENSRRQLKMHVNYHSSVGSL
jgi:hypothetical protein